ncbi:MAG: hypothetical protein QM760_05430 [Nibricoccus sp.]
MKTLFSKILLLIAVALPLQAHFVWIERDAQGNAAAYFGEWNANLRETQEGYLKLIAHPKAFSSDGKELAVTRANDRLNIAAGDAKGDLRLTDTYFGEKAKSVSFYQAKLGRTETTAKFDLELVPVEANSNSFTLFLHGKPLPDTDVTLFTSSGWNRTFKTDAAGKVTIETPWPGQAVIEVGHLEKKAGEKDGRAYEGIRHVFTLTFDVAK